MEETGIKYEKITPVFDRILIKPITYVKEGKDGKEASQHLLREIANKRILNQPIADFEVTKAMNNCGIVRSASVDCRWVSEGDVVIFGQYAGAVLSIESEDHLMIRESDVLFILKV